jgi:hypothetical protein
MTLRLAAVAFCGWAALAQTAIDPARYPWLVRSLDGQADETPFVCGVTAIPPSLNFSFRFSAGYVVRVPLGQFRGPGHHWDTIIEISSVDGGNPVYFGRRISLTEVPATHASGEFGGGYLLGEGRYRARFAMLDERRRVCRKEWTIEVKPRRSERRVGSRMPPNSIAELTWENMLARPRNSGQPAARNLTVMLDVAPLSRRRLRLRPADRLLLVTLVSAVLESVPALSVRLVAFSLDQQKELFRRDALEPHDLEQLDQTLESVELATVDYHVLQDAGGYRTMLGNLVTRELHASPAPDTVLFLGPAVRYEGKAPALENIELPPPSVFYFRYRPPFRRAAPDLPDIIDRLVSRLKGKSFAIHTPADFHRAIEKIAAVNP